MTTVDYTVSAVSARSPDMSFSEWDDFVSDIRTNGQLVPIWVQGTEVIDGRKRLAACQQLGIAPNVVNLDPSQNPEQISRALNVLRTHYSTSQRAMYAAERPTFKHGHIASQLISKSGDQPISTVEQVAREAGVGHSMVGLARKVARVGSPEVAEAVKAGKLTLHAANQIVETVPRAEQAVAVVRVVEGSEGKRNTPVAKVLDGIESRRDRAIPKPAHEQFARSVQMLDVASEVIAKYAEAAVSDARRKEFVDMLRHVRTVITRVVNILEIAA